MLTEHVGASYGAKPLTSTVQQTPPPAGPAASDITAFWETLKAVKGPGQANPASMWSPGWVPKPLEITLSESESLRSSLTLAEMSGLVPPWPMNGKVVPLSKT